jgi:hypothetical protein
LSGPIKEFIEALWLCGFAQWWGDKPACARVSFETADAARVTAFWILAPMGFAALTWFVLYLFLDRRTRETHVLSPFLVSLMAGVLSVALSTIWITLIHGSQTLASIISGALLAMLVTWPVWIILGPLSFVYVYRGSQGKPFWSNFALYSVTLISFAAELGWFRLFMSH